ncbi:MAG: hypothetical protein PHV02_04725, partial [Rhodocyclaceae bacterium]|nr:hypothetical protein [Rhodocyclaceae bacterium]
QKALVSREAEVSQLKKQLTDQLAASQKALVSREAEVSQLKKQLVLTEQKPAQQQDLQQENELLLLQLHQVQEELERYFLKYQDSKKHESLPLPSRVVSEDVFVDFKKPVSGVNWYPPEVDGAWAGPGAVSKIELPELAVGEYQVEVELVDAMAPEIIRNLSARFNGTSLFFFGGDYQYSDDIRHAKKIKYPLVLKTTFKVGVSDVGRTASLRFDFPRLISPASRGSDDQRMLAIRFGSLRIRPVVGAEIVGIDLKNPIQGCNWYEAEADGRWAGPEKTSTLHLPAVKPGKYRIAIDVVDAISPDVLAGTSYKLAGMPLKFTEQAPRGLFDRLFRPKRYPRTFVAEVALNTEQTRQHLALDFFFPKLLSPASKGSDDHRMLALRIANVTLQSVGKIDQGCR